MPADNDKPLPVSFWDEPEEGTRMKTPAAEPVVPEIETWRLSFEQLGTNVEAAMTEHYGKLNQHGVAMHTFEQVYTYMLSRDQQDAPVEEPAAVATPPEPDAKELERAARKQHADLVAAASERWHKAVAQRKEIIAQWDIYVSTLRAELQALKGKV